MAARHLVGNRLWRPVEPAMAWTKRFSRAAWAAPSCDGVNPRTCPQRRGRSYRGVDRPDRRICAELISRGDGAGAFLIFAFDKNERRTPVSRGSNSPCDHVVGFAPTRSRRRAAAIGAQLPPRPRPADGSSCLLPAVGRRRPNRQDRAESGHPGPPARRQLRAKGQLSLDLSYYHRS
jgi:hypothetical protein